MIGDPAIQALAEELARREGVTPQEAVARALQEKLGPAPPDEAASREALARLAALQARLEARGGDWPDLEELKSWGHQDGRD